MTHEEAFELFESMRDEADREAYLADCAAVRHQKEQAEDEAHLDRLFALFERRGRRAHRQQVHSFIDQFPDGFVRRHVEIENEGLPFQRVYLRASLAEAA